MGDQYRLIFVTSERRDATSGDIEDYNQFVQSVADAAPVLGKWNLEWKAMISTATVDAADNIGHIDGRDTLFPVYRLDGMALGDTPKDPSRSNFPILFNELGEIATSPDNNPRLDLILGAPVWVGGTGGQADPRNPIGVSDRASLGASADGDTTGFAVGVDLVTNAHAVYAISEVITAVPEPSGCISLVCGLPIFAIRRNKLR